MRTKEQVDEILSDFKDDIVWVDEVNDRFFWESEYFGWGYQQYQSLYFDPRVEFHRKTGFTNREWFPKEDSGYSSIPLAEAKTRLYKRIDEMSCKQQFDSVLDQLKVVVESSPPGVFSKEGGRLYNLAHDDFTERL